MDSCSGSPGHEACVAARDDDARAACAARTTTGAGTRRHTMGGDVGDTRRTTPPGLRADGAGTPGDDAAPVVEVRRSRRRSRTVSAHREDGRTIVSIPARFTRAQEREWVERMLARLAAKEERRRPSDDQLAQRAAELSARYLGGRARPSSVRWVTNMERRWGSCSIQDRSIRISARVRGLPPWVIDYVLLHELAHLLHAGHGPQFWALLDSYPRTERARGFLEGVAFLDEGTPADDGDAPSPEDVVG